VIGILSQPLTSDMTSMSSFSGKTSYIWKRYATWL
jgi:gamma-glutamyl hydrolase